MLRRPARLLLALALPLTAVAVVTAAPASGETLTASTLFAQLPTATADSSGYDRSLFGADWTDADGDGCDTRSEVLQAESSVPVTFSDGCTVATGEWTSPYDGATWTDASDVDIDHMVPLGEAWASGARTWTADQRLAYANDLDFPDHLIAVTDSVNQSKGDRDPSQWLPPLVSDRCRYAVDWVAIKWAWSLSVDTDERSALASLLSGGCGDTTVNVTKVLSQTPPATNRLLTGQALTAGQSLQAGNGYRFVVQGDGNAVVYAPAGAALWATRTSGHPGSRLVVQGDGNLVVYAPTGQALWASGTRGTGASLVVQTDGNLVEYDNAGHALWTYRTPPKPAVTDTLRAGGRLTSGAQLVSANRAYKFVVQSDGNAVLYGPSGARFATGTSGHPGASLVLQGDGNAVLYGPGALWATNTAGRGGNRLVMQGDGNLVLYSAAGAALFVRPVPAPPKPPTPTPTPPKPTPTPTPPVAHGVVPGAYCSVHGQVGYSAAGNRYVCSYYTSDGRWHWKRA